MKYTGKQIRIQFIDGDMQIYRGSAYTLEVDYSVHVYRNRELHATYSSLSIESIVEDNFGMEVLK